MCWWSIHIIQSTKDDGESCEVSRERSKERTRQMGWVSTREESKYQHHIITQSWYNEWQRYGMDHRCQWSMAQVMHCTSQIIIISWRPLSHWRTIPQYTYYLYLLLPHRVCVHVLMCNSGVKHRPFVHHSSPTMYISLIIPSNVHLPINHWHHQTRSIGCGQRNKASHGHDSKRNTQHHQRVHAIPRPPARSPSCLNDHTLAIEWSDLRDDPWRSIAAFIRHPDRVKQLGYHKPVRHMRTHAQ